MAKKNTNPEVRFAGFLDDWQKEFVGKYYDFKNGLNKSKEYFGYGKPIVNFTDVFHNRGLLSNQLNGKVDVTSDEINNYSVKKGDLFFTRTSETIEEIGQPSVMLDEPTQAVFSGFVFFTNSFRSEMVKKSSMTTRALTSGTAIKKMLFTFPKSKDEQKLIGNFFKNIDKLIAEHQQKLEKFIILRKAMLEKVFPKNGNELPEIRFDGFKEKWIKYNLGDVSPIRGGFAFKSNEFKKEGVPILKISNILPTGEVGGRFDFYDEQLQDENFLLPNNSAVLAMSGATTGKVSILKFKEDKKVYQNQRVGYFQDKGVVDYSFISILLRSALFSDKMKSVLVAGAQPNVSPKEINAFDFYIPNNSDEQKKIGTYFNNLDELIRNHNIQLVKLSNIKKAFLTKMFI